VISRYVVEPNSRQQLLIDALELNLPTTIREALTVGICKKINEVRKLLEK
jgi:hypothetical protein